MKCPHCKKDIDEVYVQVIRAKYNTYWYSKEIGSVYPVVLNAESTHYQLRDGERTISVGDCIEVTIR